MSRQQNQVKKKNIWKGREHILIPMVDVRLRVLRPVCEPFDDKRLGITGELSVWSIKVIFEELLRWLSFIFPLTSSKEELRERFWALFIRSSNGLRWSPDAELTTASVDDKSYWLLSENGSELILSDVGVNQCLSKLSDSSWKGRSTGRIRVE